MRTPILAAAALILAAGPAAAQYYGRPPGPPMVPGLGVGGPLPNATGGDAAFVYSPTGRPEDTWSNDSAAAGNAGQPSRVIPQGGGGGGSGTR